MCYQLQAINVTWHTGLAKMRSSFASSSECLSMYSVLLCMCKCRLQAVEHHDSKSHLKVESLLIRGRNQGIYE